MADKKDDDSLAQALIRLLGGEKKPEVFQENRYSVRSYLEVPIVIELGNTPINARTFDISSQGLYVRTTSLPPAGNRLNARFILPDGHTIACKLRVVWVNDYSSTSVVINRPPGFGAEFAEISEKDRSLLVESIEKKLI